MKPSKILEKVLASAANVSIADMCKLVEAFGFRQSRVKGSHHIFVHATVQELVNLQEVRGKAKPYQVRRFLKLVEEYNLRLEDDES